MGFGSAVPEARESIAIFTVNDDVLLAVDKTGAKQKKREEPYQRQGNMGNLSSKGMYFLHGILSKFELLSIKI